MDDTCNHSWLVWTTHSKPVISLGVFCQHCEATGYVPNPTKAEWFDAPNAEEDPKPWDHPVRVKQ
jgi:hypothetical protein